MRPRVNTRKHIVQFSLGSTASGAITKLKLAESVAAPAATDEVVVGSIISAMYIEMWITSDDAAAGTTIATFQKKPPGAGNMTAAQSALLNDYDGKSSVLETHMGLLGPNVQVPIPVFKHWVKIPKGKQRMELGAQLVLNLHGQSNGLSFCGFVIYKEQY